MVPRQRSSAPVIGALELSFLDAQSLSSVGNLLRALCPDLKDLDLSLKYYVNAAHLDFSHNPNLQHSVCADFGALRTKRCTRRGALALPHTHTDTHIVLHTLTIVLSLDSLSLVDSLDFAPQPRAGGVPAPRAAETAEVHGGWDRDGGGCD
ncbi:hypothetical protein B0H14DRAFT_3891649 [Mycena olivaceomarginata]|nr:hypothetical protein B0H14DRAFT_3891649 [Mycena olivaceomarginata]